jgi:hypothetical protein
MTDYGLLIRLHQQALRTRVMVLEDAIRQYLRGWEGRDGLETALGEQVREDRFWSNPRTEELREWWKHVEPDREQPYWMHDPTEVEEESEDE